MSVTDLPPENAVSDKSYASNNLNLVVERFEAGEFDLVSIGRALLHDPYWVRKVRRGEALSHFDPASLSKLT